VRREIGGSDEFSLMLADLGSGRMLPIIDAFPKSAQGKLWQFVKLLGCVSI
jgi:hypothetical protein